MAKKKKDNPDTSETGRIASKMGIKRIGGSGGDLSNGGMNMPLADDAKGKTRKGKRGNYGKK